MDWGITEKSEDANHNPVVAFRGQAGHATVHLDAESGSTVYLSAEGTSDSDGDLLAYRLWQYPEAGP
jgi:hypothetical protein